MENKEEAQEPLTPFEELEKKCDKFRHLFGKSIFQVDEALYQEVQSNKEEIEGLLKEIETLAENEPEWALSAQVLLGGDLEHILSYTPFKPVTKIEKFSGDYTEEHLSFDAATNRHYISGWVEEGKEDFGPALLSLLETIENDNVVTLFDKRTFLKKDGKYWRPAKRQLNKSRTPAEAIALIQEQCVKNREEVTAPYLSDPRLQSKDIPEWILTELRDLADVAGTRASCKNADPFDLLGGVKKLIEALENTIKRTKETNDTTS